MINNLIFISAIVVGVILLLYSILLHWKFSNAKEIDSFPVSTDINSVKLVKGKYSIDIVGAGKVDDFPLRIASENRERKVDLYRNIMKYRYIKNGTMGVNLFYFHVYEDGNYNFSVDNLGTISATQFSPALLSSLTSKINPGQLKILIKSYYSPVQFIFALILTIVSVVIVGFGIVGILIKEGIIPGVS